MRGVRFKGQLGGGQGGVEVQGAEDGAAEDLAGGAAANQLAKF